MKGDIYFSEVTVRYLTGKKKEHIKKLKCTTVGNSVAELKRNKTRYGHKLHVIVSRIKKDTGSSSKMHSVDIINVQPIKWLGKTNYDI